MKSCFMWKNNINEKICYYCYMIITIIKFSHRMAYILINKL